MWGSKGPLPPSQARSWSPGPEVSSTEPHVWLWLVCGPQPGKLSSGLAQSWDSYLPWSLPPRTCHPAGRGTRGPSSGLSPPSWIFSSSWWHPQPQCCPWWGETLLVLGYACQGAEFLPEVLPRQPPGPGAQLLSALAGMQDLVLPGATAAPGASLGLRSALIPGELTTIWPSCHKGASAGHSGLILAGGGWAG